MESGPGFLTYVAYGAICLFLLIVVLAVLRSMMLMATLVLMPIMSRLKRDETKPSPPP